MKTTTFNAIKTQFANLMTIAILALVVAFAFALVPSKAAASTSDYWGMEGDYGSQYYYEPEYDYYGSAYEPEYDYYGSYYQPEYDYYGSSDYNDYYDYSYPSYSSPSYSYQPQSYDYQYYQQPQSTPYMYTPAPNYAYQYNTPAAPATTNVNTNVANSSSNATANNTNVNNNNNVNNNPINIVINGGQPVSGTTYVPPAQASLDGNCYISPSSNVYINQDVTFTANASGGNGSYTYSWSGSDGISSNSRTFTGRFATPGSKTATVIIYSGGQSISRTCSTNVDGYNYQNNLSVYCVATPATATVGQNVVWTATVSGGGYNSGYGYTYSWIGNDNLSYGNAQTIQRSYSTPGLKTATVTVYGNGQSQSATCSTNIIGGTPISNVTVIREPGAGNPVSGVFLSQVPATGISFGWKVSLFILGLLIWSAYVGYFMVSKRKRSLAAASLSAGTMPKNASTADRISQFKLDNMRKKGLIQ